MNSVWVIKTIDREQKRYTTSDRCELNNIFVNSNDWRVVNLETSKNDEIDDIDLAKDILHGIENRMSEKIGNGNYGVTRTDNPETDEYYTVEWYYNVHTAQDDIPMKGYNPP